jgi:TRAP-type C4-dicarboxylate transport system permease small subunit
VLTVLPAVRRYGDLLEQTATTLALVTITLLIFTAVILRYFFASGIIWGEEIARVLFIAMTYLAISRVDARGIHFRVSILHDYFPRLRPYFEVAVNTIQLALLLYLAYLASAQVLFIKSIGQRSPASDFPAYIFYIPIALGLALASIRSLEKLCTSVTAVSRRAP